MKFQVGDEVVVLLTNEEGVVREILSDDMVMVEVRGVKFPAYTDQLDFPYFKRFTEKKLFADQPKPKTYIEDVPREKKKPVERKKEGFMISFIPVFYSDEFGDDIVDYFKIHLINRTDKDYYFTYTLNLHGEPDFQLKNTIRAFEDFYIHDLDFEKMNDNPAFFVECSLLKAEKAKADYYESVLKLKAKQVFNRIEELKEKGEAMFSYKLFEEYPDKLPEEEKPEGLDLSKLQQKGFKIYPASKAKSHIDPPMYELDLHIEKLTPDYKSMSNFEMLQLQLDTLEKYIDVNLAHRMPSMIVIHGIGKGKLRDEIHEYLRKRPEVKSFVNRFHPAYGYGATEVYFS